MSWVVVSRKTGKVIFETWQKSIIHRINTDNYKVVPIKEWLSSLSKK